MNTYQVKQVPFDKGIGDIPNSVEIEGHHPGHAYRNYLSSIGEEFVTIQEDDIGSTDNPCVRFISENRDTHEKFLFYIKRRL